MWLCGGFCVFVDGCVGGRTWMGVLAWARADRALEACSGGVRVPRLEAWLLLARRAQAVQGPPPCLRSELARHGVGPAERVLIQL